MIKEKCPPTLKKAAELYRDKGVMAPSEMWLQARQELYDIMKRGDVEHYDLAIAEFHKICRGEKTKKRKK